MIVTMANAKGGVAKTTGAILLAVAWARRFECEAVVLDADPQSSASLWRDMAEEAGSGLGLVDVRPANLSTLRRVARMGVDAGLVVVDAPPQGRLLEEAMKVADFVVVPTSDSPLDLQQAWATMAATPAGGRAAVLVARAEVNTRAFMDTITGLDRAGTPRFDTVVRKRQEIKRMMGADPASSYEYAQVLDELLEVAR